MLWKEFLDSYFLLNAPAVDIKNKDDIYKVTSETSSVEVNIYFTDNASRIRDIVYWSDKSGFDINDLAHYLGDGKCSEETREVVRKILETPLNHGWTELQIHLFKRPYKSIIYDGIDEKMSDKPLFSTTNKSWGCLRLILFPVFLLIDALVALRLIGKRKLVKIEPLSGGSASN